MREEATFERPDEAANMSGRGRPALQFVDSNGCSWRVFERNRRRFDEEVTLLVFESNGSLRLVRKYPSNWRTLSAEALEYLSWRV
jgi:hypothetical protein